RSRSLAGYKLVEPVSWLQNNQRRVSIGAAGTPWAQRCPYRTRSKSCGTNRLGMGLIELSCTQDLPVTVDPAAHVDPTRTMAVSTLECCRHATSYYGAIPIKLHIQLVIRVPCAQRQRVHEFNIFAPTHARSVRTEENKIICFHSLKEGAVVSGLCHRIFTIDLKQLPFISELIESVYRSANNRRTFTGFKAK